MTAIHLPTDLLRPLCRPFAKQSDTLLELYEMTASRSAHPGECIKCFFALKSVASPHSEAALQSFQSWLEDRLEIEVATTESSRGTLPVQLDEAPDLEQFCHEAIRQVREDRVETAPEIHLQLKFREEAI